MEELNRRYTDDEVSDIIRRALSRKGPRDTINHDELVDIARSSGISAEQLQAAIELEETEGEMDSAKEEWMRHKRAEFFNHLTAYCIINGFLLMVNLITSRGYFWVIWPMMGWGVGLAFHYFGTFFVNQMALERGAKRILRRRRKRIEWLREQGGI